MQVRTLTSTQAKKLQEKFQVSHLQSRQFYNQLLQQWIGVELQKHKATEDRTKLPPHRNTQIALLESVYTHVDKLSLTAEEHQEALYPLNPCLSKAYNNGISLKDFADATKVIMQEDNTAKKNLSAILFKWQELEAKSQKLAQTIQDFEKTVNNVDLKNLEVHKALKKARDEYWRCKKDLEAFRYLHLTPEKFKEIYSDLYKKLESSKDFSLPPLGTHIDNWLQHYPARILLGNLVLATILKNKVQAKLDKMKNQIFAGALLYVYQILIVSQEYKNNEKSALGEGLRGFVMNSGSTLSRGILCAFNNIPVQSTAFKSKKIPFTAREQGKFLSLFKKFILKHPEVLVNKNLENYQEKIMKDIVDLKTDLEKFKSSKPNLYTPDKLLEIDKKVEESRIQKYGNKKAKNFLEAFTRFTSENILDYLAEFSDVNNRKYQVYYYNTFFAPFKNVNPKAEIKPFNVVNSSNCKNVLSAITTFDKSRLHKPSAIDRPILYPKEKRAQCMADEKIARMREKLFANVKKLPIDLRSQQAKVEKPSKTGVPKKPKSRR